jgi:hypothetical protein
MLALRSCVEAAEHRPCNLISIKFAVLRLSTVRTYHLNLPHATFTCLIKEHSWSLTLREEHRLRVFENRALRRIFGPRRDEVTGDWRKLHNEEFHNLFFSPNIIRMINSRRMRWAELVARMGETRILAGKPEGKRTLGRPRCR